MLTVTVTDCLSNAPRSGPPVEIGQALARAAGRGEIVSFETLYRRHVGRMHRVIGRLVGHHGARAEDPEARFLPARLHHTYALRLALAQRAALT